jgi:hypothetical protein
MRVHKRCVRCDISFLGTKSMLVCPYCYGNQEDLELSDFIRSYQKVEFNPSMNRIQKIIAIIDNSTCKNGQKQL